MRQLKQSLALEASSSGNDTVQERKNKKKLLSWLKNTPVYLTLQWFDVVEEAKVSSNLLSRRWTTEITERDKLFLEKLGGGTCLLMFWVYIIQFLGYFGLTGNIKSIGETLWIIKVLHI